MNGHNDDVALAPRGFESDVGGIFNRPLQSINAPILGKFQGEDMCIREGSGLDIGRRVGRDSTVGAMGIR